MNPDHCNISLKQMRAFVAVAHAGSFTRAAEQMFITQSALSSLIRNLESELGLRLLDRTTRRLELTNEGEELLRSLVCLLGDLDRIKSDLREVNAIRRGRVRIGATPLLASTFIAAAVQAFCGQYPGITVRVVDDTATQLLHGLHEGDIDMLVATLEGEDAALASTVLLSDAMVLVCSGDHRLGQQPQARWCDMQSESMVALRRGSGLRAITDQVFDSLGMDVKPAQEVNHVSTAIALVAAGMGVAALPAYAVRFTERTRVQAVPLGPPVVERHVSLSTLRQRTLSVATSAMREHLVHFARQTYGA